MRREKRVGDEGKNERGRKKGITREERRKGRWKGSYVGRKIRKGGREEVWCVRENLI